jgi:alpha-beta hydrolase superfamily lysophospholipase
MTRSVVFIHGAWFTPLSWRGFGERFFARGYPVTAPAWPEADVPMRHLRRAPPPALADVGFAQLVEHYERIAGAHTEPPILVGHGFGALVVQTLLDRGVGSAGIALASIVPGYRNVPAVIAALPVLAAWNGGGKIHRLPFRAFARRYANGIAEADQRALHEFYVAPTPGRVFFDVHLSRGEDLDLTRSNAPLLLVAGASDRIATPKAVRAAYAVEKKSPAATALKVFPGMAHAMTVMPGWEQVADVAVAWLEDPKRGEL